MNRPTFMTGFFLRLRRAAYSGYARLNRVGHRPGSLARIVQYYYWTILKYSKLVLYILSIRTADAREGTSFPAFGDHLLPARSPHALSAAVEGVCGIGIIQKEKIQCPSS